MAPAQARPLLAIGKKAAATKSRSETNALEGSAADLLTIQNDVFTQPRTLNGRVTKKQKITRARKTTERKVPAPEPIEPSPIECWRPAGGDNVQEDQAKPKPTRTLGIARVSTWRLKTFVCEMKKLIERHGKTEPKVTTKELVHGGESLTDVYVEFRSKLVAQAIKKKINGETVEGRKLQVEKA